MKCKRLFLSMMVVLTMAGLSSAMPPQDTTELQSSPAYDYSRWIDVNRMLMFVANDGRLARDIGGVFGNDYGLYYPFTDINSIINGFATESVVYASGLWVAGTDAATGDTLVCVAAYSSEYVPGPVDLINDTASIDRPSYRVYKLYSDSMAESPNQDYLTWPADQGAPCDESGKPLLTGQQMLWSVHNDMGADRHTNSSGNTEPLGLEIQQSVFGFGDIEGLKDVVFVQYRIYNRSHRNLRDVMVSFWVDPDVGGSGDDMIGCDSSVSLGFAYNAAGGDAMYGSRPPAVGYVLLQGPLEQTGDLSDTARMFGEVLSGYRNLGMTSFNVYRNGWDPTDYAESFNCMNGLLAGGGAYVNPSTGQPTTYLYSGDPVHGTGDLDPLQGDKRMMVSTGPVDLDSGDSTEVFYGICVGMGADRLESVTRMRLCRAEAVAAYKAGFDVSNPETEGQLTVTVRKSDAALGLEITGGAFNAEGYQFEGYSIYQSESYDGGWRRIANYDVINGVDTIYDWVWNSQTGMDEYTPVRFGTDNGISNYFETDTDAIFGGKLINGVKYYYRVEAYSYRPDGSPRVMTTTRGGYVTLQGELHVDSLINMVQWSAAEGGNDHWYAVLPMAIYWRTADSLARTFSHEGHQGYLACITSPPENDFVLNRVVAGTSDHGSRSQFNLGARFSEGRWMWGTGNPVAYSNWHPGEPQRSEYDPHLLMLGPGCTYGYRQPGEWDNDRVDIGGSPAVHYWSVIEFGEPEEAVQVQLDFLPGMCPNEMSIEPYEIVGWQEDVKGPSDGLALSVNRPIVMAAIPGSAGFDPSILNGSSVELLGVRPVNWGLADVTAPYEGAGAEACECAVSGPDGFVDLLIRYDRNALITAMVEERAGETTELVVYGALDVSRYVYGYDCLLATSTELTAAPMVEQADAPELFVNSPNPFNPSTTIEFSLPAAGTAKLEVFNVLGQRVATLADGLFAAGVHQVQWDASSRASGVYFYRLEAGSHTETRKMLLLK